MLSLTGKVYGITSNPSQTIHYLAVGNPVHDEFGNENTEIVKARIPKNSVAQMQTDIHKLKGKQAVVPVYVTAWSGNNGPQAQINLDTRKAIKADE